MVCNYQLTEHRRFSKNLIKSQLQLYNFVSMNKEVSIKFESSEHEVFMIQEIDEDMRETYEVKGELENDEVAYDPIEQFEASSDLESDLIAANHEANLTRRRQSGKTG